MYVAYIVKDPSGGIIDIKTSYWLEEDAPATTILRSGFGYVEYGDDIHVHRFEPTKESLDG